MNWWYWCSLQGFLISVLIIGAIVFSYFEAPKEIEVRTSQLMLAIDVVETFLLQNSSKYRTKEERYQLLEDLLSTCNLPEISEVSKADEYVMPVKWNLANSVLFCFTIVTTIGYGHISPETLGGRIFCIFYGLLGIPLNVLLVGNLAGWFNAQLTQAKEVDSTGRSRFERWIQRLAVPFFYFIPGTVLFLVIPSIAFIISEKWTFLESIYYGFVTLSTVGFGDMVPGSNQKSPYLWLQNSFLILWVTFGAGYITAVIEAIGKVIGNTKPLPVCIELPKKFEGKIVKMSSRQGSRRSIGSNNHTHPTQAMENVISFSNSLLDIRGSLKKGSTSFKLGSILPESNSEEIYCVKAQSEPQEVSYHDNPGFNISVSETSFASNSSASISTECSEISNDEFSYKGSSSFKVGSLVPELNDKEIYCIEVQPEPQEDSCHDNPGYENNDSESSIASSSSACFYTQNSEMSNDAFSCGNIKSEIIYV
ncbi:potassium channel subfamily K member 2-like isoform X2 [Artemia franciscana]|uniref:Potassium channel domain-containing protein n=1 Tax=Artemia franciscana TaxID=6661 RepID=A0AA88H908_ARTSF|nr:hypothetical protein QYM36_014977 [Artemia franciscana]KAK2707139.1 hypothetical protein QYM36_014977 [Artemia franciscana]